MLLDVRKIDAHSPEDENLWAESVLLIFLGVEDLVENTLATFFLWKYLVTLDFCLFSGSSLVSSLLIRFYFKHVNLFSLETEKKSFEIAYYYLNKRLFTSFQVTEPCK